MLPFFVSSQLKTKTYLIYIQIIASHLRELLSLSPLRGNLFFNYLNILRFNETL
jgi:hypothetical protein